MTSSDGRTAFATSSDGVRIAYDLTGSGPVVVLLHGGGQTRRVWHDHGYVARLSDAFTVVAIDMRGNGDSDKPTSASAYATDRFCDDVGCVAEAIGAATFSVWGYSYGANAGRYLAAGSNRLMCFAMIGIGFGAAAPGKFRDYALGLAQKWTPVIEAQRSGRLDLSAMSDADRASWQKGNVETAVAQLSAIVDWPDIEPRDLRCSTLWVVGTRNETAMQSVEAHTGMLEGTPVTLELIPGLTHEDELTRVDVMLPRLRDFTRAVR